MARSMKILRAIFLAIWAELFFIGLFGLGESSGAPAPALARSNSGGGVIVKVTYLNPESADEVRFQVMLDTHSVNLDSYDLKALTILRDDAGQSYQATKVENKGSGHHREVILVFPKLSAQAKRLDLVIQDIAKVKERSFSWDLSQ